MPTENPRITITVDDEMLEQITEYRFEEKLKNQTQAVVSLIEKGMNAISDSYCSRTKQDYGIKKYHDIDNHGKRVVDAFIVTE